MLMQGFNSCTEYEKCVFVFGQDDVNTWIGDQLFFLKSNISYEEVKQFFGPDINVSSLVAGQIVSSEPVVRDDY